MLIMKNNIIKNAIQQQIHRRWKNVHTVIHVNNNLYHNVQTSSIVGNAMSTLTSSVSSSTSDQCYLSSTSPLLTISRSYYSTTILQQSSPPNSTPHTSTITSTTDTSTPNNTTGTIRPRERKPSILTTTLPPNYTTGQAWRVLQTHGKGGQFIRLEDFISLCNAAKSNKKSDARIIHKALLDLKRCNSFYVNRECAKVAMYKMKYSLLSSFKSSKEEKEEEEDVSPPLLDQKLVDGITFIGKAFLDKNTGLYFATEIDVMNQVFFKTLHSSLLHSTIHSTTTNDTPDTSTSNSLNANSTKHLIPLIKEIIDTLIYRISNPASDMKKRAARKYIKQLRCSEGPTRETIHLAVHSCLLLNNYGNGTTTTTNVNDDDANDEKDTKEEGEVEEKDEGLVAARYIVNTFNAKKFLGGCSEETLLLVSDAEQKLKQKKKMSSE
jgi:hypothetical protein